MNTAPFGDKPDVITPDKLLYDAAERVGRIREGRRALHIHLSRMLPANRDEAKIRVAFRMIESMVDLYRGQIFLLTNSDIVLICKDVRVADLEEAVYRLRALFSNDPLTYADESDDELGQFATLYDLAQDYDVFFERCTQFVSDARKILADQRATPPLKMLDSRSLVQLLERIETADVTSIVRRQPCIRIADRNTAQVLFQEFHVSIAELQKALAPDINLLSNRWLFQHLSQILDQRVLQALHDSAFAKLPVAFSLNLTMATIGTPQFEHFRNALKGRAGLFAEFQLIDVFGNLDEFFRCRDTLRDLGCLTILDGMTAVSLHLMEAELYDTDYVKLLWSPDLALPARREEMEQALGPVGLDRLILARCDTEDAVNWGLDMGIHNFQGHFLDAMTGAVTMTQCPQSSHCTLAQCIQRHGVVGGRVRSECRDHDRLDSFPPLSSAR
jgi:hypothetical protein